MKLPATRLTGLGERADDRIAGGRAQAVEARAGAKSQRLAERVRRIVEQDGHVARGLVAHDDIGQAVAVDVAHRDVRRRDAGGHGQRRRELPGRRLEGDGDAIVRARWRRSGRRARFRSSRRRSRLVGNAVVEKAVLRETLPSALIV